MDFKHFVIFALMMAVLLVLVMGVITMMRGGEANRRNSNRLMSLRVGLQAITILLLGAMFIFGKH